MMPFHFTGILQYACGAEWEEIKPFEDVLFWFKLMLIMDIRSD